MSTSERRRPGRSDGRGLRPDQGHHRLGPAGQPEDRGRRQHPLQPQARQLGGVHPPPPRFGLHRRERGALGRAREALAEAVLRLLGASLGDRLGLGVADISWQPARDRVVEYVGVLGLIGLAENLAIRAKARLAPVA